MERSTPLTLEVFERPPDPTDELPAGDCAFSVLTREQEDFPPDEADPGPLLLDRSRLVFDLGTPLSSVYAVPSTRGLMCVGVPANVVFCSDRTMEFQYWDPAGGRPVILGLVPKETVSVEIRDGKNKVRALVDDEVFFYRFPRGGVDPLQASIDIHLPNDEVIPLTV